MILKTNLIRAARFSAIAFCLLTAATISAAQVVYDGTGSGAAFNNAGVTTFSWKHTVAAGGTNRALFVAVSTTADPVLPSLPICTTQPLLCTSPSLPGSASARVVSVTYNGDAMQPIGFQVSPDLKNAVEIYRLVAPDAGMEYDVVVNLNPLSVFQVVGGSNSFTGVSQTTPNGAFNSANGTNNQPTVTVADAVVGDAVLDALAVPPAALYAVVGANQTERYTGRSFFNTAYDLGAGSTEPGAIGAETMSWTTTNNANWALAAVAVRQSVSTAAAVSVNGRVTSGDRGVARARVTMIDANGAARTVLTNFSGYFRFDNVATGKTYIFNAAAKRQSFSPRVVNVNDEITNLNLTADF